VVTNERVSSILEAACRVVVRDGVHRMRMAGVAEEAGVSKALVHYYFTTRRELLRSAFAWADGQWQAALDAETAREGTGRERLERILLATIAPKRPFREQRALWNEVWSSLRFDDEIGPLVEESYRSWLDRLVALIEDGQRDGSVPKDVDAQAAGWRLAAVGDGIDSMLYIGLVSRARAVDLLQGGIRSELGGA
jgi:TetR/AcrR family transcriptional regulator, transcriptional repressor of bet genes